MTFKHKLSMRLALLRNAATAVAAIAILGCAGDMAVAPDGPSFGVTAGQVLIQENFEDAAFASRSWYDNTAMATTTAQHIPGSTRALEARFSPGATNPTWGGAARHLFPATPTLYVSYWVKYSDNWVGSGRAYHPHELLILSDQDGDWDGPSNNWLAAYIEHNYQNGGIPRLQLQDNKAINTASGALPNNLTTTTENRSIGGCNGVVEANVVATCFNMPPWYNGKELSAPQVWFQPNPGTGYKGNWNHVEVYFQMNSIVAGKGVPDGVIQYWFNGAPVIDRHDILFRTGARPNLQFHQLMIAPYIGDGSPVDQTMWIDDLTVGTGAQSAPPPPPPPPPPTPDTSVQSVTVSPVSASVAVGATRQLAATVKGVNGATLTGRTVSWTSSAPTVATVSATGLVTALQTGSATISAASEGKSGTSAITVTAGKPSAVTTLRVASVSENAITLSFAEVNDGTGRPASYQVRFRAGSLSWGSGSDVANGTCKVPMSGTAIGATRTCTVSGLAVARTYQFQMVAFRGTLNGNAVFSALSNKVSGTTGATAAPAPVASVTLSPGSASLATAATQQLAATVKDAAGVTLTGRAITWASSAPLVATVNSNGLVTALAAGPATITATSEGKVGSAAVTVTAPVVTNPGTVTNLSVSGVTDTSVTLSFTEVSGGAGLPASYDVRYAAGTLSWGSATAVTRGTCRVVLAGMSIGAARTCTVLGLTPATAYQFEVVGFRGTLNVDAVFGALSNVASGTTTAGAVPPPPLPPPPPPPPPPSGGMWPNEPAGFTLLTDEPFNALVENGWRQVQRQTTNGSGLFLTADPTAPLSLSSVLEFKYAAGYTGGSEPGVEYYNPASPVKETYFAFWWKPSSPWQNHGGSGVNKLAFLFPSAGTCIYIMMFNEGAGYTIQVEPEFSGDTRRLAPNRTGTPVVLGVWHRVEWYVKYSTTGSSRDGVTRWWLDGVLQGEYTDLQMPGDAGFTEYQLAPTWGGIGGTKSQPDYYWFDHARISKR